MTPQPLSTALEREHRDIDGGIEAFIAAGGADDDGALTRALAALRRHIYLEETFLFPALREAGMTMPIFVMEREHGQLWDTMDLFEDRLAAGAGPADLVKICNTLLQQLDRHNSKEEPIIYPQADVRLDADSGTALAGFMASGRTPDGWICARAGA